MLRVHWILTGKYNYGLKVYYRSCEIITSISTHVCLLWKVILSSMACAFLEILGMWNLHICCLLFSPFFSLLHQFNFYNVNFEIFAFTLVNSSSKLSKVVKMIVIFRLIVTVLSCSLVWNAHHLFVPVMRHGACFIWIFSLYKIV